MYCKYVTMCNKDKHKMNKVLKIKEVFLSLCSERKDEVRKILSSRFNISVDTAKNHWIYNGGIPVKYQDEVLKILKHEAQEQVNDVQSLIDTIKTV